MKKQKLNKWGWSIFIALALMLIMAGPVLAQGPGGLLEGGIQSVIDFIQGFSLIVGALMLVLFGAAKIARPIYPQGMQFFNNYWLEMVMGFILIYGGSSIVEAIVGFVGGGG